MKKQLFYTLTLSIIISVCSLMSCGGNAETMSDEEIERLASEQFKTMADTLTKQSNLECDSMYAKYRQAMVDSLIFEYLKSEDSTSTINQN